MKIYTTTIRPVVTYTSGTWTLTAKDENNLRIFEMQILKKILGFVVPCIFKYSNKNTQPDATIKRKIYCLVA
jgi:hypothetical protein